MKVFIGEYQHRHGSDLCAYATRELAEEGRQAIALKYWNQEIPTKITKPETPEAFADAYFEYMAHRDESFYIHELEVEGA